MKQLRELGISFKKYERLPYPKNLGKKSKLGGDPEWIQEAEKVECPFCHKEMTFIAQIDSIDYSNEKYNEYIFGDIGMIYIFFCFECLQTKSVFQTF